MYSFPLSKIRWAWFWNNENLIIQVSIVMKQHPRIFLFFLIPESATLKLGAMFRYFIVTFLVLRQHCLTDCHRNLDLFVFLFLPPHDFAPSSPTRNLRYSISISITAKIILKYDWFKKKKNITCSSNKINASLWKLCD